MSTEDKAYLAHFAGLFNPTMDNKENVSNTKRCATWAWLRLSEMAAMCLCSKPVASLCRFSSLLRYTTELRGRGRGKGV